MFLKSASTAQPAPSPQPQTAAQPEPSHLQPARLQAESAPTLLLIGHGRRAEAVRQRLRVLQVDIVQLPWSDELHEAHLDRAAGQILVEPAGKKDQARLLTRLDNASRETLPTHVVLGDDPSRARVSKLYKQGASAVFCWPSESELMPWCVAELLAVRHARGPATKADTALARTIRARLRWVAGPGTPLSVSVRGGTVYLAGHVATLPIKRDVEETAWSVPGVSSVDIGDLWVEPDPALTSSDILRALSRVLRCAPDLDARTLTLSVSAGEATIAGTVASKQQLDRVRSLCERIRGLRELKVLAVVEPRQQRDDRRLAKRLQHIVSASDSGRDVRVSAFGGTVVLTGRVDAARERRRIESLLAGDDEVERIVNKITCP